MQQLMECEVPLYRIRGYGEFMVRVTKRLFNPLKVSKKEKPQETEKPVGKFDSALSRAKNIVREISLCNDWEFFVTLTFDRQRWDRYSLSDRVNELMQWIQNQNKKGARIRYLIVPEFHQDGAVHFHGLISGIRPAPRPSGWPKSVNRKEDGTYYDIWPEFSDRYGYSSVELVQDPVAVGFYVSKYITKSLANSADLKGVHTYYRSRGLFRAVDIGSVYHDSQLLDKFCKYENSFYKFGFARVDGIGKITSLCDEVEPMFQNIVVTDPVSGELVACFGGDSEDEYVQEILAAFKDSGMRCSVYDLPD